LTIGTADDLRDDRDACIDVRHEMSHARAGISVRKTVVGRGVFATRRFKKSEVIGQMRGSVVVDDDYDPDYAVDLGAHGTLEPWAPFRYLNHSCEPNAELVMMEPEDDEPPTMWVESRRAILPGEQITIDYMWPAEEAIPCLCGTRRCRGWVVEAKLLNKVARIKGKAALEANPINRAPSRSRGNARP